MDFKLTKSKETFHFNPPVEVKEDRMIGLITLEVYNSIFIITEENNKFELYAGYLDDEFPYIQLRDKVAEVLGLSDISPEEQNHEKHGPNNIKLMENYQQKRVSLLVSTY